MGFVEGVECYMTQNIATQVNFIFAIRRIIDFTKGIVYAAKIHLCHNMLTELYSKNDNTAYVITAGLCDAFLD